MLTKWRKRPSKSLAEAVEELIQERDELRQQRDALAAELLAVKKESDPEARVVLLERNSEPVVVLASEKS